jgi:hypothetical protein
VYSSNALDHTISPRVCVQQMCAVLRPGGILFLEGFVRNGTLERWSGLRQHDLVPEDERLIHYDRNGTSADLTADLPLACVHLEVAPFRAVGSAASGPATAPAATSPGASTVFARAARSIAKPTNATV